MKRKNEIVCDTCGNGFATARKGKKDAQIQTRKIAEEDDGAVKEIFFTCPYCGRKYTIGIEDRQQAMYKQQRRILAERYNMLKKTEGTEKKIENIEQQIEELKRKQIARDAMLKELYREEIETWEQ